MPRTPILLGALLLLSSPAFAAPRYMARVRVARAAPSPAPAPSPSPAAEAPQPRLARIVALAHRTEPAGEPTLHPHARFIDAEAMDSFFPAKPESGGGFMPLTLRRRDGIHPREDAEAARAQHTVVFADGGSDGSASMPSPYDAGPSLHNRDQGGRPSEPARKSNRSRFYLR